MNSSQLLHLAIFGILIIAMAPRLPRFAMERPVTLGMVLLGTVLFGAAALLRSPVELMPNVAYGNVTVFIDVRGGMPPPEVERLVTKPVEEGMGTVSRLRNLTSSSKKDRSIVTLEFDPGTDMDMAAMEVREKFLRVKPKLPPEIEKPIIARYEESDAPVVVAALTSERYTPEHLRAIVDSDIKERLMRVDGVANVEVGGGRERKIVVDVDRNKLAAVGLPITKAVGVLESNNINLRTGQVEGSRTVLFGVRALGAFRSMEDIKNITLAVSPNGGRVRLKDVAEVKDSFLEHESYSRLNAKAAVTMYIQKESTANTVKTAGQALEELEEFKKRLPKHVEMVVISNQRGAIMAAIEAVRITLVYGIALVVLVLPLFLSKTRVSRVIVGALLAVLVIFYALNMSLQVTEVPVMLVVAGICALAVVRPDIRTSLVVAACIPASVCVTLALMYLEGVTINVMSLSGLILGIGLLVDNAVVVIENYDRIVHEDPKLPLRKAMVRAADEMVGSIVGGTTVVVFLPFSLLQKQAQMLFAGISFTVTASLFSSLFVALTLIPALGALINPTLFKEDEWDRKIEAMGERLKAKGTRLYSRLSPVASRLWTFFHSHWPKLAWTSVVVALLAALKTAMDVPVVPGAYILLAACLLIAGLARVPDYEKNLRWALAHPKKVFAAVGAVFAAALAMFLFVIPKDFMASSEQSEFVIFVELDTGVRLDVSNRVVEEVEKTVRDFEETKNDIKNVSSKVEGWSSKVFVTLNDASQRRRATQDVIKLLRDPVDKVVEKYEKQYKAFSYFSEPRSGKEVFVEIYGYEYDMMAKLAIEIAGRMGKVPGLSDVKVRYRPGRPQLSVFVDPLRASIFGLDTKEVSESLHAQMRGLRATTFYDRAQEVETVVRLRGDQRETIEQMKDLLLVTSGGEQIPVRHVARIRGDLSPSEIWHRNRARMIQVSANLGTTSLEEAANKVKQILLKVKFPPEYYADIGGQYEDMMQANRDFYKALAMTIFLVFMVMACQFESYFRPFVVMGTVTLSIIGSVAALALLNTTITLGVSVGLLMLGGIVVNNGIMLIDRMQILKQEDPKLDTHSLLVAAGVTRLRPIFMTTSTTVIGLVPMALDRSESAVLWAPLAITVIGGLVSATILTLFIVPSLYLQLELGLARLKTGFPEWVSGWRARVRQLRAAH
jgi:hydrophobic/amphiphilic exporter-1 (mainly G- bacteria), HAE1 family